ncbi:hypothetical protein HYH03_018096 [Edaphochlamys debaryana]|uniref:Uncharacterized protein n=1 Tax=Edaphochlamys debaryana TaxID=47281 RepID=A0A835XFZ0_9CHLO|nr:hypothetical protein HYH03_018096 [Edaphochlamys debaryana]|eukprot:KAG2483016.1 hypothetical protein HYH03_018096 [Edaphochlamys debaryana]
MVLKNLRKKEGAVVRLLSRAARTAFDRQAQRLMVSSPTLDTEAASFMLAARRVLRGCRPRELVIVNSDILCAQTLLRTLVDAAAGDPSRPCRTTSLALLQSTLVRSSLLQTAAAALPNLKQLSLVAWEDDQDWRGEAAAAVTLALSGCGMGKHVVPSLLPNVTRISLLWNHYRVMSPAFFKALAGAEQLRELVIEDNCFTELDQAHQLSALSQLQSLSVPLRDELYPEELERFGELDERPKKGELACALLPGQLTGLTRLELSSVGTALPAAALRGLTRLRELVGYDVDVVGVSGLCALTSLKANQLVPFVGGKPWAADVSAPISEVQSWPLPRGLERLVLSPQHPEELGFLSPGPALREVVLTSVIVPLPNYVTLTLRQGRHSATADSEELLPAAEEALCRAAAFLAKNVKPTALEISFWRPEELDGEDIWPRLLPPGGAAAMAEGRPSHGRWLTALGGITSMTYLQLDGIRLAPQDLETMATHMTGLRVLELNGLCSYPVEALAKLGPMTNLRRLYLHVDHWPCHDNDPDEGFSNAVLSGLDPGLLGLYSHGGFQGALAFAGLAGRTESELRVRELRRAVERVEAEVGRGLEVSIEDLFDEGGEQGEGEGAGDDAEGDGEDGAASDKGEGEDDGQRGDGP